ncbi:helix-turn-helix domain-containing protein [Streptomyces sp. S.PB5]|uniref:helix-turn-helix domain-containing protein n=1 Tax=Streptomyces sp. S.PB5 TaxID=3020844 RepID=UPI0025B0F175|nr:helix-turn-helix domain-containing protein [Streptomyces sp. S.PB5]MDN3024004.1 helix-turn-helix domain-containing protein [Streptomyces sp. S.PB5]
MTTAERPTIRRPALASVRRARELFLRGGQLPDGVPEEIVAAWRRARFFGVRHDVRVPAPAPVVPPPVSPLLSAARPVLERIAPTLDSGRTTLLLTDERLRVLRAIGFTPDHSPHDLSEQVVGHNSAALALHTRRRAEVHGPEHFLDLWQDVSAVSVPVRAPESGHLLGTVTVSSGLCVECGPHPGAPLAEAAASAVEAELLARSQAAERVLLDAYLRAAGEQGRAVVALDGRNRFVSEAAGRSLSPEGLESLERRVVALMRDGAAACARPEKATGHGPSDGMAGAGYAHPPAATLTPVRHQDSVIGAVAVLEPAEHTATAPAAPAVIGPAGRSVPWRHAVGRATELAGSSEPLLLVGERGTGKTTLARELVPDALIADAAEGELGPEVEELLRGRPLLIRHAERLAPSDTATLNSLLDTRPGVPLLATYTPGTPANPCLQRLLDTLAARSVTLPALRERPEDIRELLTSLAPGPAPGQPPLTWTLDALRALEQHPWPGNLTELAHLVRALAEQRRMTGPVRRTELPDPVREGPAPRPLTRMERAERTAILEALRLHGGNKASAAAALGIGRATLYRKLRGYRG